MDINNIDRALFGVSLLICAQDINPSCGNHTWISSVTCFPPSTTYLYISQISLLSSHDSYALSSCLLSKGHCCYSHCATCKNPTRNVYATPSVRASHTYSYTCCILYISVWILTGEGTCFRDNEKLTLSGKLCNGYRRRGSPEAPCPSLVPLQPLVLCNLSWGTLPWHSISLL